MVRGIVYSILALIVFLALSVIWMTSRHLSADELTLLSGWVLLISFFAIGPLFFAIGFLHDRKRNPKAPKWDAELSE